MALTQHASSALNVVRGYREGEVRVNETGYRGTVIVSPDRLLHEPGAVTLQAAVTLDMTAVRAQQPELILLGTGVKQVFPPASFAAQFLRDGIGVEVMDTGAACRTYNVLMAEQRRVVAILLA